MLRFVCEALAFAHRDGVVHRDLKPSNLMRDTRGYIKVMDFGIARDLRREGAAGAAGLGGTLPYMAPEQHDGEATAQSDVFALGVTAYGLLTGSLPFPGPDYEEQKRAQRYAAPPETVPAPLREFVAECLKADPGARPQGTARMLRGQPRRKQAPPDVPGG